MFRSVVAPCIQVESLTLLHRAAYEGDVVNVARLLAGGVLPDEPGLVSDESDGYRDIPGPSYVATALMLAAASQERRSADVLKRLLTAGADPTTESTRGQTALDFAALTGNTRATRLLLGAGALPDRPARITPLCTAAARGDVNGVRLLLWAGASPNPIPDDRDELPAEPAYAFRIPLFAAAEGGSGECIRLLVAAGARVHALDLHGATALMHASSRDAVRALIAAGCSLDARTEPCAGPGSAIDHAAEHGCIEAVHALVEAGADIEARSEYGLTPLLRYCSSSEIDASMVTTLIQAGANVHARWFRGRTALHEAAQLVSGDRRGRLGPVIRVLIEAGLDVNVRDDNYSTPLHYAAGDEGVDLGAVETLLQLGANPDLKNDFGRTPRDEAPDHVRQWRRILKDRPESEHRPWYELALLESEKVAELLHR